MKPGFRQSMSWLHTWGTLWLGWVLVCVFITGAMAVFADDLTYWMQPEQMRSNQRPVLPASELIAAAQAQMAPDISNTTAWLNIELDGHADQYGRTTRYYWWQTELGKSWGALGGLDFIDAHTGLPRQNGVVPEGSVESVKIRDTASGRFFSIVHYTLTPSGNRWGFWLVFVATMAFLLALVSGIIVHKKIFADFFTFRPSKGQRSWLDAHNALAVMTLPFLFMIAYTGLSFFPEGYLAPVSGLRQEHKAVLGLNEPASEGVRRAPGVQTHALADMGELARRFEAQGDEVRHVNAGRLDTEEPFIKMTTQKGSVFTFDAVTGRLLNDAEAAERVGRDAPVINPVRRAQGVMRALHEGHFGGRSYWVSWLYFFSSMAAAAMMAVGLLLFMVKRRQKSGNEFGRLTPWMYSVFDTFNLVAVAGVCMGCIGILWANRLLPVDLQAWTGRHHIEQLSFYLFIAASFGHAVWRVAQQRLQQAWVEQLAALAGLCVLLPWVNAIGSSGHLLRYIQAGEWQAAGVDLAATGLGLLFGWGAWRVAHVKLKPIKIKPKTQAKIKQAEATA